MTKNEKRKLISEVKERLRAVYPVAECALEYKGDPWRLMVMARLSAQCTDARVNEVSHALFDRFPNALSMAESEPSEIAEYIKSCGLWRMKAENLRDMSRELLLRYGGVVPDNMEDLLSLSGIGRKTANLILGDIYGKGALVCDTHFICILGRLGMYPESERDAKKIEFIMRELMDISDGSEFCHRIVTFGREYCTSRAPKCRECPLSDICPHNNLPKNERRIRGINGKRK